MPFLQKYTWEWVFGHFPPALIFAVIILVLVVWIAVKVDRNMKQEQREREKSSEERKTQAKQLAKIEVFCGELPCVDKTNATWLQNPKQNGGRPPNEFCCKYLKSITRA